MAQVVTDPDVLKQFAAAPDMDVAPKPQAAAGQAGAVVTDPDILKQFNSAPEYNPSPVGPQPAPAPPSPPPPRPTANDNIISATLDKANPEEQAKAKAIGSQLNVPTGIVLRNMPGYNKAAERQNAIAEVSSNPMLRDWVAEHPDNAKIAMDDFAALKRALVATADFGTTAYMTLSQFSGDKVVRAGVDAAAKAGAIGWADTKVDADLANLDKLGESYGLWDLKDNKQGGLGYLNRGVVMFLPAMLALGIKSAKAGFYGAFSGWGGAMENLTEQLGLQGELTGVLSGEFMHPGGFSGLHVPHPTAIEPGFEHLSPAKMRVQQLIEPFRKADEVKKGDASIETQATGTKFPNTAAAEPYVPPFNRSIEVYLENGEEPPTGHDYLTDQLHIQQTIKDADSFQKAYDVVKEAKLKKRSPEDLTDLLDKQLDGQSVYIPAETVQKLYEGVEPHPKDERLGWADNAQQKVATAQALGTDMEVPLSQFLAHADDSLVGAIKDQIRFREKGPSVEEAKVLQDKEPETYPVHTQASKDAVGDLYDSNPELFPLKRKVIDSGRTGRPTKTEPIKPGATERLVEDLSKRVTPPELPPTIEPTERTVNPKATPAEKMSLRRYVLEQAGEDNEVAALVNRSKLGEETVVYRGHANEDPTASLTKVISTSASRQVAEESGPIVSKIIIDSEAPALRIEHHFGEDYGGEEEILLSKSGKLIPTGEPNTYRFVGPEYEQGLTVLEPKPPAEGEQRRSMHHILQRNDETGRWGSSYATYNRDDLPIAIQDLRRSHPDAEFIHAETVGDHEGQLNAISRNLEERDRDEEARAAGLDPKKLEYLTGEEKPEQETKLVEDLTAEPVKTAEGVEGAEGPPTDISAAARIPHLPEVPHEVPKPPEGPPPLPKGVEAPKPAEAPKPPPVPKTFDNLGTVATQGLVDDAVESVKGVQNPRIDLTVDPLTRTVTVHDNGAGYSPEELTNHLETSDLNKVLYLHHNTGIVIYTLHDGEFSTVKSDGRGIRGAYKAGERFEPDTRPEQPDDAKMFPDGHGTRIELDVPSEYLHPKDGQLKPIDLPEQPRVEIPPHIEATVNGAKLEEAPTAPQVVPPPIPEETPLTRAIKRERKALYLDPLFNAKSVGLDQNWFAAYSRKIAVQARDIYQKALEAARKQVAKRLTPEWKADRARTRTEAERDMFSHPTIAAERFIRLGELPTGEHVPKPLLDEKAVADLGGKNLDRYTIKKRGQHPDDIAPRVGFKTGKEMIDALNNFEKQRAGYDKSPREFIDHLIERETDFRMEEQFGDLKEKILDEAREIVTTNTHIEIMADELKKIAELGKIPFDKDTLPTEVHKQFQGHSARTVSYEKFRRAAEKHAKEAEKALLKGDYIGAFQAKQKQYMDVLHAKEARVFEKKRAAAEKQWRRITSQDKAPNTNTQEYWDNARKILNDINFRKIDNLQEPAIDLNTLINNSSGQAAVAPWLINITPGVEYKNLPVVAFDALHDSIRSIIHAGAEARKLDSLHGKATLDNFIFDVGQLFSRFPTVVSDRSGTIRQQVAWRVRQGLASHTLVERMLDYSDRFDPDGVLTRFLDRPMRDSWNKEVELKEMVMTMARDLEQHTDKSVNDLIDNKAIRDPNHGGYVPMTRQNLRHIILWSGSEEGLAKLTKGYNISHDQLFDLIQKNARPEDFAWANQYFKIFEKLYEEAASMVRRYTGVEMDKRVARPWGMKLKDGTIVNNDGGYAPLYYDHTKPGGIRNPGLKGDLFDENYFPVTTPHSYTQDVTKAAGWLDMNGTLLTNKIQQMIHDIAFRESVRNAQKIIADSRFRQLVNRHWGTEYTAQLDSWLKTIANVHAQDDAYAQGAANVMAHLRVGTVGTLINMSRSVAMKHGVSALAMSVAQRGYASMSAEFARLGGPAMYAALKQLWQKPTKFLSHDERETARQFLKDPSSMDFVMNSSPFMRERLRPYADSLRGALQRGSEAGIMQGARQAVAFSDQVGRTMVAMSDAGSAFTTWTGAYKDALMKHGDHADAVFEADRAVGRAHGSSFPGDKPKVLQIPNTASGQFWKTVTSLYSYWSHAMNNMMQLGWDIKARTMRGAGSEPGANMASIAHRVFLLAIVPMIMEEAAAPAMSGDEHGGWLRKGTFAALRFMGGLSPYTRDPASMIFEGYEPTVGMIGQALKEGYQIRQDVASWVNNDKEGKNWIKHLGTALGTLRVPFASQAAGALVQGVSKQMRGQATPKWENDDWTAEQYRALYGTGNIPKKVWRKR